jgi:hypothetical protein
MGQPRWPAAAGIPLARDSSVTDFTFSWPMVLLAAGVVIVIGVLVAFGVMALERRNRAELTAERIQQAIGEALAGERALAGASILPVAVLPAGGRPTLELTGYVGSDAARAEAVRLTEATLRRLRPDMELIDHLDVLPSLRERRRPA